jgi:glutathione S-transferase
VLLNRDENRSRSVSYKGSYQISAFVQVFGRREAQTPSWMSFIASTLHPARRRGLDYASEVYTIADRRLGNGWALGRYSIADIHLFRLYWRLANSLKPAPEIFPNLTAHYARMMARPAVQLTIEIESAIGHELPA